MICQTQPNTQRNILPPSDLQEFLKHSGRNIEKETYFPESSKRTSTEIEVSTPCLLDLLSCSRAHHGTTGPSLDRTGRRERSCPVLSCPYNSRNDSSRAIDISTLCVPSRYMSNLPVQPVPVRVPRSGDEPWVIPAQPWVDGPSGVHEKKKKKMLQCIMLNLEVNPFIYIHIFFLWMLHQVIFVILQLVMCFVDSTYLV